MCIYTGMIFFFSLCAEQGRKQAPSAKKNKVEEVVATKWQQTDVIYAYTAIYIYVYTSTPHRNHAVVCSIYLYIYIYYIIILRTYTYPLFSRYPLDSFFCFCFCFVADGACFLTPRTKKNK